MCPKCGALPDEGGVWVDVTKKGPKGTWLKRLLDGSLRKFKVTQLPLRAEHLHELELVDV